ncbi:MAG: hypothetical protein KAR42_07565 [candidate division Zixibacteria bacterium]|nr:hypothetical protein [candidate division Zixibacteria bacterium]
MRQIGKAFVWGLTLLICMLLVSASMASKMRRTRHFELSLTPVVPLAKNAPVSLDFSFELKPKYSHRAGDTGSVAITVLSYRDQTDTISSEFYQINYDSKHTFGGTLHFTPPDIDVVEIRFRIKCGTITSRDSRYIIYRDDSIELIDIADTKGNPFPKQKSKKVINQKELYRLSRGELTKEQLQIEYDIAICIRDSKERAIVEKIIGPIPDSCLYDIVSHVYKIRTTHEKGFDIGEQGIECDFIYPIINKYPKNEVNDNDSQSALPSLLAPQASRAIAKIS